MKTENVFWCDKDALVKTSENASEVCQTCGKEMRQIGWFEYDRTFLRDS